MTTAEYLAVEAELNTRWGESTFKLDTSRMAALMDLLGHPERAQPVILVAGTNGKTSVTIMIDSLLRALGLRTGRFTSPHLQLATERISIDGQVISPDAYVSAWREIEPYVHMVDASSEVAMSKFEVLTAMAYAVFADAPVEVAVLEVGLGGIGDCTNVADANIAVITPIGYDHTEVLGDTLTEIARNKAGIIKPGATAVIGLQTEEAMTELLRAAVATDVVVARAGSEFSLLRRDIAVGGQSIVLQGLSDVYDDIFLPLSGPHQADNASLALAACEALLGAGRSKSLDAEAIRDGFAAVKVPGRLEKVRTSPAVYIDAAHNAHGARALAAALQQEFTFDRLVGVLAILEGKDAPGILEELAEVLDEVVITVNSSPRCLPAAELAALAVEIFAAKNVHLASRMDEALALAVDLAETDSLVGTGVLVTGSVVSAGDARTLVGLAPA